MKNKQRTKERTKLCTLSSKSNLPQRGQVSFQTFNSFKSCSAWHSTRRCLTCSLNPQAPANPACKIIKQEPKSHSLVISQGKKNNPVENSVAKEATPQEQYSSPISSAYSGPLTGQQMPEKRSTLESLLQTIQSCRKKQTSRALSIGYLTLSISPWFHLVVFTVNKV